MASRWILAVLVALLAVAPSAAQQPLPLDPGKDWKHKHSGIIVPATLAGTPRDRGMTYAPDELDLGLSFVVGDAAESLTVYIFRNTNGAVPVWFSQAQWGIEHRGNFGHPALAVAPVAFVPPGQKNESGLKSIYTPDRGGYRSTGLMLLPVGPWYVKIRASSQTRTPTELGVWMDTALSEIRWPKKIVDGPLATPVADCASPLSFPETAKDAPRDEGAEMVAGLLGAATAQQRAKPTARSAAALSTVRWCRDAIIGDNAATYRQNDATGWYLLTAGDNGNGIWVGPDPGAKLLALTGKGQSAPAQRFSITLMTAAQDIAFVTQDRLPSPERVLEIVNANRRITSVATWGKKRKIGVYSEPQ